MKFNSDANPWSFFFAHFKKQLQAIKWEICESIVLVLIWPQHKKILKPIGKMTERSLLSEIICFSLIECSPAVACA